MNTERKVHDRLLTELLDAAHVGDDVKTVYVPLNTLGREMIAKLPSATGSILVISDAGLLVSVLQRLKAEGLDSSNVTFVCHTEALREVGSKFGVKTILVCYNELSDWLKEDMGLKFDIIVGNPPYKAGMHLDFLELSMACLASDGSLLFVHPSEWLLQKKTDTTKAKRQAELREHVANSVRAEVTFIDNPWGDEVVLQAPLVVTHLMPGSGAAFEDMRTEPTYALPEITPVPRAKQELNSLSEVTLFGESGSAASFLKKVFAHHESWAGKDHVENGSFFVNMMRISTGGKKPKAMMYDDGKERSVTSRYSFIDDRSLMITNSPMRAAPSAVARSKGKTEGNEKVWVSFKTEQEAQNALAFLTKTKFFRALLVLIKIDQHAAGPALLRAVPWLDWTKAWNDEALNKFFKLTKAEVQNINSVVDQVTVK